MPQKTTEPRADEILSRRERVRHLCFLIWAIIGILILIAGVGWVLGQITSALAIIALSAFIVFILRVPVAWMEQHQVPRWLGSLIAYLGGLLLIALILFIFIPIVWNQTSSLIRSIPDNLSIFTASFNEYYVQYAYLLQDSNIQQVISSAASSLSGWTVDLAKQSAQGAITIGTNLVTTVIVLLVSLIVGFWVLMDLPKIGRELQIIIGPKREKEVVFVASTFSRAFGGYLRGMTICAICTGTIAGLGYYLIGLPYPAVLGLLTGLMNFVPYVGPWIAGIVAALIGLFVGPLVAVLSIVVTIIAEEFTDIMIYPRVMSSAVELHPAVVLVGVFAGGALGGVIGLIIAVPLLASAKAIFVYYFEKRTGRNLSHEKGALFKGHRDKQGKGTAQEPTDQPEVKEPTDQPETVAADKPLIQVSDADDKEHREKQ